MKLNCKTRVGAICLVVATLVLVGYTQWWIPNRKLIDLEWMTSTPQAEMRRVCHQVLRIPGGNHHDAFILLESAGDESSIPLLIWALRWQEDTPSPSQSMICTKVHCLEALQHITGANAGMNYRDWKTWSAGKKNRSDSPRPPA